MATTPAIDYDALAQQHGATVDYDSLAAQHGGSATAQPGLLDKANEYAGKALSAAGLPTSLSNVPDWFRHLTGTHPNSEPFWAPIREAIKNPTQENLVNAVPFIGPSAVSMSKDVKQGNYGGAAATLAGTVGAGVLPTKTGEIAGGLNQAGQVLGDTAGAAKGAIGTALRTPEGKLRPVVKVAAKLGGTAAGHAIGIPGAGELGGYLLGEDVADTIIPKRPAPKATVPASGSDLVAKPVSPEGPTYPALQEDSRAALNKPQSSNILTSESQKQPQSTSTPSVSPLSSPPAPNLPGGPGSFNSPTVPDLEDVLNQATGSKPPQPNVPLREQLGSAAQAKVANVPAQEPNYAYRVRSQGEEGLPISQGNKGAHATTTLEDAQRLSEGRGALPENEGVPQEIVRFDLNKLGDQDYTRVPREGGPDWLRLSRPLKESELEMVRPQGETPPVQPPKMETPASSSGALENPWAASMKDQPVYKNNPDLFKERYGEGDSWYHGTGADFKDFKNEGVQRTTSDWNSLLGTHFAAEQGVAEDFAGGRYSGKPGGRVIEAKLNISNPATFNLEADLGDAALKHAMDKGLISPSDAKKVVPDFDPNASYGEGNSIIKSLPKSRQNQIASSFKDSLRNQGYDGVVYGNSVEGHFGNKAAIAFDPQQIKQVPSGTGVTPAPETDPLKLKYPDPAQRQMVRANGERIVQAIGDDPDTMKAVHDLTRVDLRQALINSGEDMGQRTVSNSKFAGEGSITREDAFNRLLAKGYSPQDIVRLAKQVPKP